MQDVAGRVALVTGGAQGIGRGIAEALVRAGARVALADVDRDRLRTAEDELATVAGDCSVVATYELDVADRAGFARTVDDAEECLGPVEILCNNAGLGSTVPVTEMTYELWDRVLGVNLGGVVHGVQTVLPRMLDRGGPGHIVNVASAAGLVATRHLSYVTSKYAVVGMTESLALQPELTQAGIGVTVVCPGLVRTDVLHNSRRHLPGWTGDDEGHAVLQRYGLAPSVVGDQVVAGIVANSLYVHTNRYIEPLLAERVRALQLALPEETERDRQLAALLQARIGDRAEMPMSSAGARTAASTPSARS